MTFGKDKEKINTCETGTVDLSDHDPIHLTFDLKLQPRTSNWKLNSNLIKDLHTKKLIIKEIQHYLEINDTGVSLPILWDAMKEGS